MYKRVLLKISGEALAAGRGFGVDAVFIHEIAHEIAEVARTGCQIAIVVAKAHPDPAKLKRAGSLKIKDQFPMVTEFALSQARVIVRYAPELANASPRFRRA